MSDIGQRKKIKVVYRQIESCEDTHKVEFCVNAAEWESMTNVEKLVMVEEEVLADLIFDWTEEDVERGS